MVISFSQCHGRWNWKTKLPYSTWIRDIHLLCKLSIQSSLWIWFNESRSVGHFLFIIQHQIIFIILYTRRYLHLFFNFIVHGTGKTKLSNYTWIRDVQLLCKLSIQSSRWIWFNESRSVGHFLFIIHHHIIFIIFYSLRYLHLILYLFSIYYFIYF